MGTIAAPSRFLPPPGLAFARGPDRIDAATPHSQHQQARNSANPADLSEEAQQVVRKLQQADVRVRAHEAAHKAAGGGLAGAASYTYTRGPDGRMYATAGEVSIKIPASADPNQRIADLDTVIRAALAPADPSGQDMAVAASARQMQAQARLEAAEQERQNLAGHEGGRPAAGMASSPIVIAAESADHPTKTNRPAFAAAAEAYRRTAALVTARQADSPSA